MLSGNVDRKIFPVKISEQVTTPVLRQLNTIIVIIQLLLKLMSTSSIKSLVVLCQTGSSE